MIQKFGNAVGLQVIGIVLAMVGYDASKEVQSASAVSGIQNISTIFLADPFSNFYRLHSCLSGKQESLCEITGSK